MARKMIDGKDLFIVKVQKSIAGPKSILIYDKKRDIWLQQPGHKNARRIFGKSESKVKAFWYAHLEGTIICLDFPAAKNERKGIHHNALDDCKFQVQYCVAALNIIKERMKA